MTDEQAAAQAAKKASGKELHLVPARQARALVPGFDLNDDDNYTDFDVRVPKHAADSVALGSKISGAIGETRPVEVGIRNDGPPDVLIPTERWASSAEITLPGGVKASAVDEQCVPVIGGQAGLGSARKAEWADLPLLAV
jgi:hypothetical protein